MVSIEQSVHADRQRGGGSNVSEWQSNHYWHSEWHQSIKKDIFQALSELRTFACLGITASFVRTHGHARNLLQQTRIQ